MTDRPSGADVPAFQRWLIQFGTYLANLRKEMEACTDWIYNEYPAWAAYHAIMTARLADLEKFPVVRPVVIG